MRTLFLFLAAVFLLPGCLTDNMEKITKDTKASVDSSGKHLEEAIKLQKIKAAMDIVVGHKVTLPTGEVVTMHAPFYIRVTAAETVLTLAEEERIGKYIASVHQFMPVIARVEKFTVATDKGPQELEVDLPNVTMIGDYKDANVEWSGLSEDFFLVFSTTIYANKSGLISQLIDASKKPGVTGETWAELNTKARRVAKVATILAGATASVDIQPMLLNLLAGQSLREARPYREPFAKRLHIARKLLVMAVAYNFTEEEILELKALCDVRMGVKL